MVKKCCDICGKEITSTKLQCNCVEYPQKSVEADFYYEGNRVVFTARFLKKRGYCCQSGCRHCPYGGLEV